MMLTPNSVSQFPSPVVDVASKVRSFLVVGALGLMVAGCTPPPLGRAMIDADPLATFISAFDGSGASSGGVATLPVPGAERTFNVLSANGLTAQGPSDIAGYFQQPEWLPIEVTADALVPQVEMLYRRNLMQPLWHDGVRWLPAALDTAQVLVQAKRHGLIPAEYLSAGGLLPNMASSNPAAIAQAEIALTSGVLRYIVDTKEGRYAPTKRIDPVAEFLVGAQSNDYLNWLESLGGAGWMYQRMVAAHGQHDRLSGAAWDRYRVTMEKLRWDAPTVPDGGRYVLLNVGAAEVWAMNGMQIDLGVNAVVGRKSRRTPLNNDSITSLKFAPDWTAPYSIIEKDLVKFAKEDPGFVNLMGVEIFQGNQKVDPYSIDWHNINVRRYVFRQPPGPTNVLGGVRFTLENSQAIYMHDSPDRSLFDDPFRAKSSGCVRVGASDEFALWLLQAQDPSWTLERVHARMRQPNSNFEQLAQKVPVRTIYTTAWVSHNGQLVTFPDVYGQNDDLRRQMGMQIEQVDDGGLTQHIRDIGDVF